MTGLLRFAVGLTVPATTALELWFQARYVGKEIYGRYL
jgi:hypothetical protein